MLNALLGLELRVDLGRRSSYTTKLVSCYRPRVGSQHIPAAAAGSMGVLGFVAGLRGSPLRLTGDLLRRSSECLAAGDRERLSNRERLGGSASV